MEKKFAIQNNKARQDLIATNKLEAGTYYVVSGSTTKSPLGGNIKYYTTKCDKINYIESNNLIPTEKQLAQLAHTESSLKNIVSLTFYKEKSQFCPLGYSLKPFIGLAYFFVNFFIFSS